MEKNKIIIVDHNFSQCDSIIDAIKFKLPHFQAEHYHYPEEAMKNLGNLEEVSVIITGLYFPGNGQYKGDSYKGFKFYKEIKGINSNMPVIINTNVPSDLPTFGKVKEIHDFLENDLMKQDKFYEPKKGGIELLKIIKENYNIY